MITQKTWTDIADFIAEVDRREGATPNASFYRTLANESLAIISDLLGPIERSWTNAAGGDITVSGNSFTIPADCATPEQVEWNGLILGRRSRAELHELDDIWREAVGTEPSAWYSDGNTVYLDLTPTGTVVGMLTLRGKGYISEFSDSPAASNPLAYIPHRFAMLPAYYVLANLPAKSVDTVQHSPGGIPVRTRDTSALERQARYDALWQQGLVQLSDSLDKRRQEPFTYD